MRMQFYELFAWLSMIRYSHITMIYIMPGSSITKRKACYEHNIYVLYDVSVSYHLFLWYQSLAVWYHILPGICVIGIMTFECFHPSVFSPSRVPPFRVSPFGVFRAHLLAYVFRIDCISLYCSIYDLQYKYMYLSWRLKIHHCMCKVAVLC